MHPADANAVLRRLPKVDDVLGRPALRELLERAPRWAVVSAVRGEIERLRAQAAAAPPDGTHKIEVDADAVARAVAALVAHSLRPVVNATGVVLHTNLGRAPLAEAAVARVAQVARGYSNLEYQLDERRRGSRHDHVVRLVTALTGAEDALVVNNCAAAVLLSLSALASGRGVIVSRGELVEIGGSFRVPDVMRASGARLIEVGTTNRTHLGDYQITDDAALLLKVHRSNFAQVGFVAEVSVAELAEHAHAHGRRAMVDLGSGALVDVMPLLAGEKVDEPVVAAVIAAGADVVTFSGDKLLGGPQAGLIVGRRDALAPMRTHPLLRALRPDKLTLAALEATLELYRDGRAVAEVPTLAMLAAGEAQLEPRAQILRAACAAAQPRLSYDVVRVRSAVGGGSLPGCEPWSWAVAVGGRPPDVLEVALRRADPPVIGRIAEDRLILDVRTLRDGEEAAVARALKETMLD